ncbi:uncharacterized protein K02A2.6-like [Wyeomyia smithii]|uniref:uncharacterized protein K02A2.6-like n=1 Tax=Wyeomyia smithii TaxID=174621 RepID=UPI002467EFE6|nr:uncharacterized protein K02A2.6-like [Wyeomyia smithii]
MPVVDDHIARLGKGTIWSKLDIKEAFLQIELDDESKDVTTFITGRGLFRFKRMPFGLVTAPELFQRAMDEILAGCEGVASYLDDVIIEGKDMDEHDTRLNENRDPTFRYEDSSFVIVVANYMNKFIPNLATIDQPLRKLLAKDVKFEWSKEQNDAFNEIKSALSKVQNLGFYRLADRTAVIADASPHGLGFNQHNEHRVVSFASKSLTETERNEKIIVRAVTLSARSCTAFTWKEIKEASMSDSEIKIVLDSLLNDVDSLPIEYRVVRNELCQFEDVLLRGDRIVIPKSLRTRVLSAAHDGHPGITMMKNHLSSTGSTGGNDSQPPPSYPWHTLAIDFLGPLPEEQSLLVVIDYYSRFIEVCEMETTTATDVVGELAIMFGRFGIPSFIKADNAPQFSTECTEIEEFCKCTGFKILNTIPYWPQSNGEVERQNRSILKRLRIAQELGQDWRKELRDYILTYH